MILSLLALATPAQPCLIDSTAANDLAAKLEENPDDRSANQPEVLTIKAPNFECLSIEITRPDGARYILQDEDIEGAVDQISIPLRKEGQMDLENLPGLPGFFNTAGIYELNIWNKNSAGAYREPLFRKQLMWQFPECSLTTYFVDQWIIDVQSYDSIYDSLVVEKTQRGYNVHISDPDFESFDVSMSACTATGLSININGLKSDKRSHVLNDAINILRKVDVDFVGKHESSLKQLGDSLNMLDVSDELDVIHLYGEVASGVNGEDVRVGISLNL